MVTDAPGRVGAKMIRRLVDAGADVKAMVMAGGSRAGKLATFPQVEVAEADFGGSGTINAACTDVTQLVHFAVQFVARGLPARAGGIDSDAPAVRSRGEVLGELDEARLARVVRGFGETARDLRPMFRVPALRTRGYRAP